MHKESNGDSQIKFDLIEPFIFVRPHVLKRLSEFAVSGLKELNQSGKVEEYTAAPETPQTEKATSPSI